MREPIRVIVIDDSAFMRKSLSMLLESDPEIKVIATARDGQEGIEKIRSYRPDLVTLDVEMPRMDGLTALRVIMKEIPLPVLMVSSLTTEGAQATLDALNLGAVDFIPKQLSYVSLDIIKIKEELIHKVKTIVRSRSLRHRLARWRTKSGFSDDTPVQHSLENQAMALSRVAKPAVPLRLTAIGVSTGGPPALQQIIPKIPADYPTGIAIVQHMPPKFTRSLAERLDGLSSIHVKEAEEGDVLKPGVALIAPGGFHLTFFKNGYELVAKISEQPAYTLYRPSVDVMMSSIAAVYSGGVLGVILTGMGKDGLEGLQRIKRNGGYVIAQDEESCVVYGMPKAAVDAGIADAVLPLERIPEAMVQVVMNKT